jgi:hypothetical protein
MTRWYKVTEANQSAIDRYEDSEPEDDGEEDEDDEEELEEDGEEEPEGM